MYMKCEILKFGVISTIMPVVDTMLELRHYYFKSSMSLGPICPWSMSCWSWCVMNFEVWCRWDHCACGRCYV